MKFLFVRCNCSGVDCSRKRPWPVMPKWGNLSFFFYILLMVSPYLTSLGYLWSRFYYIRQGTKMAGFWKLMHTTQTSREEWDLLQIGVQDWISILWRMARMALFLSANLIFCWFSNMPLCLFMTKPALNFQ